MTEPRRSAAFLAVNALGSIYSRTSRTKRARSGHDRRYDSPRKVRKRAGTDNKGQTESRNYGISGDESPRNPRFALISALNIAAR